MLCGGSGRKLDRNSRNYNAVIDREEEFLDVGHHFDDCSSHQTRRRMATNQLIVNHILPRDKLLEKLQLLGLTERPQPKGTSSRRL